MTKRVLVADDSLYARMILKKSVQELFSNVEFIETTSGSETLAKHEAQEDIDFFLLDVNMGEPNGFDTACALVERGVPVSNIALITGNRSSELQEKASQIHLRYINKAISPNDMEQFVLRLKTFFAGEKV